MARYKRYCKTLELEPDPEKIAGYKRLHARGNTWPEITAGMKAVGIVDMEIYIAGTTLFMIMDTIADFNHDEAMSRLAGMERQSEWEKTVSVFQKTSPDASAKDKWRLLERIYKLDEQRDERAENGYLEDRPA
ncbi:L-rhamnose mutarotase [bacterium]|nr:L-rhamnose mutarotase [bacterium]